MTMPGSDILLSADSFRQLHLAAKSMRDLADGLDCYANDAKPNGLFKISRDLNRTGWNALYTATIMRDLATLTQYYLDNDHLLQPEEFYQQVDALCTAINYMSRNVTALKNEIKRMEIDQQQEALATLQDLAQRIKGVLHECKSR